MLYPEKFRESLFAFGVDKSVIDSIMLGNESITATSPRAKRGAFFKRATEIIDSALPESEARDLYEYCACGISGAKLKASEEFAHINAGTPTEERLQKIRKAHYLNLGEPYLEPDGSLLINAVAYRPNGVYECGCTNYRRLKRDYDVSKTYCCCCGGHFRFHYEIMLGVKLKLKEVVSSALENGGERGCVFRYNIIKTEDA